ncbi:MAG TPA: MFS transporter, partial [Micromonospora sp.]
VTATAVVLTLHVLELGHGYAAAGLVGAASTVGNAIGSPLVGRLVDRRGLRPVLVVTTVAEALFWGTAPFWPYVFLLVAAFFGGMFTLPVFSVVRQSLAALVDEGRRRQAYALDSMSVELSFMAGPALAVLLATAVSPRVAVLAVGAGMVSAGVALFLLNPPVTGESETARSLPAPPRREWLSPSLVGVLALSAAGTLVLGGTDVAVVAVLREAGQIGWTGTVLAMWGFYSLVGGFAYGAAHRSSSALPLVALLGLCTIPVGFAGDRWWLLGLALLPAGALCAPSLAATADAVSRLVPASVRGEAMGLHGSALTVGLALGAPLSGAVMDGWGPAWGFAATGLLGLLVALVVLVSPLRPRPATEPVRPVTDPQPASAIPTSVS